MKTFKKTLPLILLSVLLALSMLIAGCTKEPQTNANEEENQTETVQKDDADQAEEEEGLDHVKLTMITAGVPQSDHALVNDAINKYIKEDLNVTLDFQQIDFASWQDKSNLIIASGEECDILFTGDWTQYPTDAAKGAFIALDDLIPQYAPDIYAANYNWLLDAARINGNIYAVPTYQILAQSRGFILRKDLVDKYGPKVDFEVKDVNDPEDLEPLLNVIKENEPNMTPLYQVPWKHLAFLGSYDRQGKEPTAINCYDDEPVYVNYYSTDYYIERAELARSWFEAGLTNADIATSKEEVKTIYAAGNIFAVGFQTNPSEKASIENMTGFEIVMYPTISPIISTSLARGAMFAIPIQSENPERALMFLNKLHTDKNLVNMFVYGIEGTHYVKREGEDNIIDPAPGVDTTNTPYVNQIWMFGNQSLLYTYGDEDPDAPTVLKKFNDNAVRSPALGFSYNPENMQNELAALANVVAEYDPVISSGAVDMYEDGIYDKFLEKLQAAGIEKLLEDQNSQLQEWMDINK